MADSTRPLVLICATSVYGHVRPVRAIAKDLIRRGYDVTFLTGSDFKECLESIGARFIQLPDTANITEVGIHAMVEESLKSPGPLAAADAMTKRFIEVIPDQHAGIQTALGEITDRCPGRKVVMLVEASFRGALPLVLGAPGIHPVGYVGIGIVPLALVSADTAPFGLGLPPDSSPEGKERNLALHKKDREVKYWPTQERFQQVLKEMEVIKQTDKFFREANYWLLDRFVQMCTPSFEYPRSDAPSTIQFAGGLPPGLRDPCTDMPAWWCEVIAKDKNVVFVSQGTINQDPNDLIIPTMQAFKDQSEIIVIVALGKKGSSLPKGTYIPQNSRIADFIPYDEILDAADVFITNGGYGAVQHGLSHGVPMVVAGIQSDKGENAMRTEWSGVGLNLRNDKPSPEMVQEAIMKILGDPKYKNQAKAIQSEMRNYDPVGVVADNIELVASC